ncbi:hypothetical protein M9H77_00945 [Catharanthus roseus]|uniref:Uncharacterized protein n=1 Tax=Catharanthus roseus TaxID=4058 RepID=A0ACC0C448_CATRO|nr:hypothetical protein M9H77_00945 [Catharanthus roseus]
MAKGKLILICQSGGQFMTNEDGTLSYDGGEANAVNINHETLYDDLKLRVAEMCNLDQKTISMKYFLPGNRRTLITLRNEKDLKRMLDFHGNSITADLFLTGKEGFDRESLKVHSTRGVNVKVAETVETVLSLAANSVSPNMTSRDKKAVLSEATAPIITPDTLIDVNVTLASPSQTTGDSTAPSANDADDDSDYSPRRAVAPDTTADSPTSFDTNGTPADTVKKRRRTATWKLGATGPVIVADADSDGERRLKKKKKATGILLPKTDDLEPTTDCNPSSEHDNLEATTYCNPSSEHDDLEPIGDSDQSVDVLDSPCAIAIRDQEFPENLVANWRDGITGVGQGFKSFKEFRDALQKYAIAHRIVYTLKSNDTVRAIGTCVADGCPWKIHAAWVPASQSFRIKKFENIHTCGGKAWKSAHPGRNWLVSIIKDRLQESPHCKPKEIANGIFQDFGVELSYTQVWRAFEHAREQLQGSYKYSYNQLPSFCRKVVETNPGSFAKLVTDDEKRFKCLFVSFHCLIHGFCDGCRPLLFLESTSLKSEYQEVLLTATAVDADDGFFPVAFAIVDVENHETWRWFLEQIKSAISTPESITFVSDRDKGLKSCVLEVFENAFHGYSIYHLLESFKRNLREGPFHGDATGLLPKIFLSAAHAVRLVSFQKLCEQIKQVSSQSYDWVIQIEPECWTSLLFRGEPYNYITENVAELYKKLMEDVQEATIMQKIQALICMISGLIKARQAESSLWSSKLTPSIEKRLQADTAKALSFKVLFSSDTVAEVHDDCNHVVKIETQECSCLEWKQNRLPCRHAIAVLNSKGKSLYDYCPKHFTVETYRSIYSESLHLIPGIGKPERKRKADAETVKVLPLQQKRKADSGSVEVLPLLQEKYNSETVQELPVRQEKADSETMQELPELQEKAVSETMQELPEQQNRPDSGTVEVLAVSQERADSETMQELPEQEEKVDSGTAEVLAPQEKADSGIMPQLPEQLEKADSETMQEVPEQQEMVDFGPMEVVPLLQEKADSETMQELPEQQENSDSETKRELPEQQEKADSGTVKVLAETLERADSETMQDLPEQQEKADSGTGEVLAAPQEKADSETMQEFPEQQEKVDSETMQELPEQKEKIDSEIKQELPEQQERADSGAVERDDSETMQELPEQQEKADSGTGEMPAALQQKADSETMQKVPQQQEKVDSETTGEHPEQQEKADSGTTMEVLAAPSQERADSETTQDLPKQQLGKAADSDTGKVPAAAAQEKADEPETTQELPEQQQEKADSETGEVWHEESDSDLDEVLPPNPPELTREQKKQRARMDALNRRTVTCRRCKEPGHNKASCKATLL